MWCTVNAGADAAASVHLEYAVTVFTAVPTRSRNRVSSPILPSQPPRHARLVDIDRDFLFVRSIVIYRHCIVSVGWLLLRWLCSDRLCYNSGRFNSYFYILTLSWLQSFFSGNFSNIRDMRCRYTTQLLLESLPFVFDVLLLSGRRERWSSTTTAGESAAIVIILLIEIPSGLCA